MPPIPNLTEQEKVRMRHHLDFLNVAEAYTLAFGVPMAAEPQFWIEGAMDRIKVEALPLARELLSKCDATEAQMFEDQENHAVRKLGDIEINPDEFDVLERRLNYWRNRLATLLGVTPNPIAMGRNDGGVNVPRG